MKVFISCDMEGVTPVVFYDEVSGREEAFKRACEWMTEEVNAAVEGAFDGGADTVRICDAHASGRNIIPERLDRRAELVRGNFRPNGMMEGLDESFDGVLFIGYHAKAGTTPAILPHSYSGRLIYRIKVNGEEFGETALNAAFAGTLGIPVLFLSGDTEVCREAEEFIPGIVTFATKEPLSSGSASFKNIKEVHRSMREKVREAVRLRKAKPFRVSEPVTVEMEFARPMFAEAASMMPLTERKDPRTVVMKIPDYRNAFRAFRAAINLAAPLSH